MKRVIGLVFLLVAVIGCAKHEEVCVLKIFDSSGEVLLEDCDAEILGCDDPHDVYVRVSDAKMLEKITRERVGDFLGFSINGGRASKSIVVEPIVGGVIAIGRGQPDAIFDNEKEAVESLLLPLTE